MLIPLLCATLLGAAPASDVPLAPPPRGTVQSRAPLFAALGATLAVSGTVIWLVSNVQQGTVADHGLNPAELEVARSRLQQTALGGAGLALVGVCSVGLAAVLWRWEQTPPVAAAPVLWPRGGGVSLAGRFP